MDGQLTAPSNALFLPLVALGQPAGFSSASLVPAAVVDVPLF